MPTRDWWSLVMSPSAPYEKSQVFGFRGEYGRKKLTEGLHQEWSLRLNLTQHGKTYQVHT